MVNFQSQQYVIEADSRLSVLSRLLKRPKHKNSKAVKNRILRDMKFTGLMMPQISARRRNCSFAGGTMLRCPRAAEQSRRGPRTNTQHRCTWANCNKRPKYTHRFLQAARAPLVGTNTTPMQSITQATCRRFPVVRRQTAAIRSGQTRPGATAR